MGKPTQKQGPGNRSRSSERFVSNDAAPTYFVPSFSVRRHVAREDEPKVTKMQKQVKRILGKQWRVPLPSELTVKVIDQRQFIERMRQAEARPTPQQMKDLALSVQAGLTELLSNAPAELVLPVGRLGIFGYNNQALGLQIEGWRGYAARYEMHDTDARLTPHGTVVAENQFCLGAVVAAMGEIADGDFVVDGLARTPHVTIARNTAGIPTHHLRHLVDDLNEAIPDTLLMGDPVIDLTLERRQQSEIIPVRQAYHSLVAA